MLAAAAGFSAIRVASKPQPQASPQPIVEQPNNTPEPFANASIAPTVSPSTTAQISNSQQKATSQVEAPVTSSTKRRRKRRIYNEDTSSSGNNSSRNSNNSSNSRNSRNSDNSSDSSNYRTRSNRTNSDSSDSNETPKRTNSTNRNNSENTGGSSTPKNPSTPSLIEKLRSVRDSRSSSFDKKKSQEAPARSNSVVIPSAPTSGSQRSGSEVVVPTQETKENSTDKSTPKEEKQPE